MSKERSGEMKRILGLYIQTKEERKRKEEEVLYYYFPLGEEQRDKIGELLRELVPTEKKEDLLMYYMQIKDRMNKDSSKNFEEIVSEIKKKYIIIDVDEKINQYFKAVLDADTYMSESMLLPTAEEIRKKVG